MNAFIGALLIVAATLAATAAALRKSLPRLAPFALSLAIAFVIVAMLEVALNALNLGKSPIDVSYPENYYGVDPGGVQQPTPGAHRTIARRVKTGEVLYDVTYTIDDFGRRIVPTSGGPYRSYAAFVGDSFTYGDGVQDDQTLPAAFARKHPDYRVYNYGFHGAGPFDVLARLETLDTHAAIAESTGVVIYTFIDEHVLRTKDFFSGARYRGRKVEYDLRADGELVRCKTWALCHPLHHRLMRMLGESRILRITGVEARYGVFPRDIDRTVYAICRMNEVVAARWPRSRFCVVFYPGCRLAPRLASRLEACGVRTFDLSAAFAGLDPPNVLSLDDRHPNADAYVRVADLISVD